VYSKADKALNFIAPHLGSYKFGDKVSKQMLPLTLSGKIRVRLWIENIV
jgi:hypothetical protein